MEAFRGSYERDHAGRNEIIMIQQKSIGINLRSTPATYLEIADAIRALFAKENHVSASWFSFNSKGACPLCKGRGIIVSDTVSYTHLDVYKRQATMNSRMTGV